MSYHLVDWSTLADTVGTLRARTGLTQTALAARSGLDTKTVARVENATARAVRAGTLRSLERGLRLPPRHLNAVLGLPRDDDADLMPVGLNLGYADGSADLPTGRDRVPSTAGENSRTAKLTEADVLDILARPSSGPDRQTARQVAEEFGVSEGQVKRLRRGESWRHLRGRVAS